MKNKLDWILPLVMFVFGCIMIVGCNYLPPSPSAYCWNMWNLRNEESRALGKIDPDVKNRASQCDMDVTRRDGD